MTHSPDNYVKDKDVNFKVQLTGTDAAGPPATLNRLLLRLLIALLLAWLLTFAIQEIRVNRSNAVLEETQQQLQQVNEVLNSDQQVLLTRLQDLEKIADDHRQLCTELENQSTSCQ